MPTQPLFKKVDCVQIPVPDLERGLRFYRDQLGHELLWRTDTAAGLRLPETDAELVLQAERPEFEVNLLVADVETAVKALAQAGGEIVQLPFDIPIGRCAVVQYPWDNRLVILDLSKGLLKTDDQKNVLFEHPEEDGAD